MTPEQIENAAQDRAARVLDGRKVIQRSKEILNAAEVKSGNDEEALLVSDAFQKLENLAKKLIVFHQEFFDVYFMVSALVHKTSSSVDCVNGQSQSIGEESHQPEAERQYAAANPTPTPNRTEAAA